MKRLFNEHANKWGLGIGDWGLANPQSPQSPIPNPHFYFQFFFYYFYKKNKFHYLSRANKISLF
jgi:hypothetical protein